MTITSGQIILYFGALIILFLTPGPVWVAIIARTVSGGSKSSISLALGVSLGDMLWPIIVFLGLGFLISLYSDILLVIRYFAAAILAIMGLQIILKRNCFLKENDRLTKAGFFSGFSAGFIAITANPKASLFYLTLLPGFFDFSKINMFDLTIISITSFSVPMIGNLLLIFFLDRVRFFLSSAKAISTTNLLSGISLIIVGIVIALN
jgi:threonine/homoserine/homoserine lactone efflux protein